MKILINTLWNVNKIYNGVLNIRCNFKSSQIIPLHWFFLQISVKYFDLDMVTPTVSKWEVLTLFKKFYLFSGMYLVDLWTPQRDMRFIYLVFVDTQALSPRNGKTVKLIIITVLVYDVTTYNFSTPIRTKRSKMKNPIDDICFDMHVIQKKICTCRLVDKKHNNLMLDHKLVN